MFGDYGFMSGNWFVCGITLLLVWGVLSLLIVYLWKLINRK